MAADGRYGVVEARRGRAGDVLVLLGILHWSGTMVFEVIAMVALLGWSRGRAS